MSKFGRISCVLVPAGVMVLSFALVFVTALSLPHLEGASKVKQGDSASCQPIQTGKDLLLNHWDKI